jgi:endonuclease
VPPEIDPDNDSSHEIRRALKNVGWRLEVLEDRVLLIKPSDGDTTYGNELLNTGSEEEMTSEVTIEAAEVTFGLERDLQSALRANIDQLEPGLTIIDGGKERSTEAGRIDITAEDSQGNIVVIELKAGSAGPEVIAQVLAYMGAVSAVEGKPVRGLLVAGEFHKRVIFANRAVPNLELRRYSFQFSFKPVE